MRRPRPHRRCVKIAYATQVDALIAMKAGEVRAHVIPGAYPPVAAYACRYCFRWHITSQAQRTRKKA